MAKFKWTSGQINRANKQLRIILIDIIKTKNRDFDGHLIKKITGKLRRNIRTILKIEGNDIIIDMDVMEYYQYLDAGTRHIKPWFLTEEFMDDPRTEEVIETLLFEGFENAIIDVVSKF